MALLGRRRVRADGSLGDEGARRILPILLRGLSVRAALLAQFGWRLGMSPAQWLRNGADSAPRCRSCTLAFRMTLAGMKAPILQLLFAKPVRASAVCGATAPGFDR
jgi:hypothetical protein